MQFEPSDLSCTPAERAERLLRHLSLVASKLADRVKNDENVPLWVLDRIYAAANPLLLAAKFLDFETPSQSGNKSTASVKKMPNKKVKK